MLRRGLADAAQDTQQRLHAQGLGSREGALRAYDFDVAKGFYKSTRVVHAAPYGLHEKLLKVYHRTARFSISGEQRFACSG